MVVWDKNPPVGNRVKLINYSFDLILVMLKSKSTTDILTQTDTSYRQYGILCTSMRTEIKTVESFEKHSIFFYYCHSVFQEYFKSD